MAASEAGLRGTGFNLDGLLTLRHAAKRLRLHAQTYPVSWRAGSHASKIRGRGMSFAESRPYQNGDDVRLIDWRVTARSGRAHTKVFEEEKERAVFVVGQFSPSMYFGTRVAFKHVVAAEVAALVGWAAIAGGDRIGALLASASGHDELKPASGRRALMRLLHALQARADAAAMGGETSLRETLSRSVEVVRTGSLVFVIGDFYDFEDKARKSMARLAQHNDVVICQVLDRVELAAPPPGRYPVSDGRRSGEMTIAGPAEGVYERLGERLCAPVKQFARGHRLIYGLVTAEQPVSAQLERILG